MTKPLPLSPEAQLIAHDAADDAIASFGEHMDDADKYAVAFARRYTTARLAGRQGASHSPELHPLVAKLVRECVDEALSMARRKKAA